MPLQKNMSMFHQAPDIVGRLQALAIACNTNYDDWMEDLLKEMSQKTARGSLSLSLDEIEQAYLKGDIGQKYRKRK